MTPPLPLSTVVLPRWIQRAPRALVVLVLAVLVTGAPVASAQGDPRQEQEQVRQQQAQAAAAISALKADAASVQGALAALQANVAGQEALLSDATLAANVAEQAAAQARAEADAARVKVSALSGQLKAQAIAAYVTGPSASSGDDISPDADATTRLTRDALIGIRAGEDAELLDQLHAAEQDASDAQATAEQQAAVAEQKRAEIAQRTSQVRAARDQQAAFVSQVEARLDQRLSEAASLASQDKALSLQIAAQEAAVAARVPRSSGGGTPSTFTAANISLTTVDGITVASSIASQLHSMIQAAAADGISLGGSGYRDPAQQQALREQHCANPATDPPSACSPPTARPGTSMHERGLAVDFTANGHLIQSHSDPGFVWLSGHAANYGFYNLPSEPWHWSTTGD
jgi:LAS superfamily LD-carboxypeptidase LdcB